MSRNATTYFIFIAGPSETNQDKEVVKRALGALSRPTLQWPKPRMYIGETVEAIRPGVGNTHPQDQIDKWLPSYDGIIAIFRKSLGSPTKSHESGTLEEIDCMLRLKQAGYDKKIAVYTWTGAPTKVEQAIQSLGPIRWGRFSQLDELSCQVVQHFGQEDELPQIVGPRGGSMNTMQNTPVSPGLEDFLQGDEKLQQFAAEKTQRAGDEEVQKTVQGLLQALDRSEPSSSGGNAMSSLGFLRATEAVQRVGKFLLADDIPVRERAAYALGEIGGDGASEVLLSFLDDADDSLKPRVICAIGRTGSKKAVLKLVSMLSHQDPEVAMEAARALLELGDEKHFSSVLEVFERTMDDWLEACLVARMLGYSGKIEAVPILEKGLTSRQQEVRMDSVTALGRIGLKYSVTVLGAMVKKEPQTHIIAAIARALGEIGAPDAVEILAQMLESFELSRDAARSLGQIGHADGVSHLEKLLHKRSESREWAIWALGKTKSEQSLSTLANTYTVVGSLRLDVFEKSLLCAALLRQGSTIANLESDAAAALHTAIGGYANEFSRYAGRPLLLTRVGMLGLRQFAYLPLEAMDGIGLGLRDKAAWALGEIGTEICVEALRSLTEDRLASVRWQARKALNAVDKA